MGLGFGLGVKDNRIFAKRSIKINIVIEHRN